MRRLVLVLTIIALLGIIPASLAQTDTSAPIYVRYCQPEDFTLALNAVGSVEAQLTTLNELLVRYDSGSVSAIEGTDTARELLTLWTNSEQVDCLAPFNKDMQQALSDFLLAMVYWQLDQTGERDFFLQSARNTLINVNSRRNAAVAYLQNPPLVETTVEVVPTEEVAVDTTTQVVPLALRDGIELKDLLMAQLIEEGITLLRADETSVTVSELSNSGNIVIAIDSLPDFDEANVDFTFDTLAALIAEWQELPLITGITVDVYDENGAIVLSSTSTGDNFRAFYYDETLTQEQFDAALVVSQ